MKGTVPKRLDICYDSHHSQLLLLKMYVEAYKILAILIMHLFFFLGKLSPLSVFIKMAATEKKRCLAGFLEARLALTA